MMHENLVRMKAVGLALKDLKQEYVFVGGATVALYATNSDLASEVRPTDDVDVIVELATYWGYSELDERLRGIGFQNDISSGVICRYTIQGIIVDVMPTDPKAIGFSNRWYPDGFATAREIRLDDETVVKIFTLPYFVASKWEAFKGRGKNDYRTSKDFEDLVYILENVDDFEEQLKNGPEQVRKWLKEEIELVMDNDNFEEGLYAHLTGGYSGLDANYIKQKLKAVFKS
ncbi:putative nucleotidyltransferase [Pedobacter sp. UYEF25]